MPDDNYLAGIIKIPKGTYYTGRTAASAFTELETLLKNKTIKIMLIEKIIWINKLAV